MNNLLIEQNQETVGDIFKNLLFTIRNTFQEFIIRKPYKGECIMTKHRIYTTSFAKVYPLYVTKAEEKGHSKTEVDEIICWLTGYSQEELDAQLVVS